MITLLVSSFLAWVLTILAPCVLPVLPVILAGSITERQRWYPYLVTLSLAGSIVLFTILLKASTLLIDIPSSFWKYLSGGILLILWLIYIFPHVWAWIGSRLGLGRSSIPLDHAQGIGSPVLRAIATGAALGPVFSTCSPTYSLLLATVFPVSFFSGIAYTTIYALWLAIMLTIIAIWGRSIIARFRGIADERWWFKKILGFVFVLIGLAIVSGVDKQIESRVLDIWNPSSLEESLIDSLMPRKVVEELTTIVLPIISTGVSIESTSELPMTMADPIVVEKTLFPTPPSPSVPTPEKITPPTPPAVSKIATPIVPTPPIVPVPELSIQSPYRAPELSGLTNWINSDPLTLSNLRWQVVIVDFWTFGCSNCQATLPHVQALYAKYRSQWLIVIGVHAPEFAYEQKYANVLAAVKKAWLTYPVALDNGFSTWNAYDNQYWPAMYIIDKSGKVRHTHFGEGQYQETDDIIAYLLSEK